jgi:purine-binding chemotaxis protein CheW
VPRRKERPDPNKSLVGFVVGDVAYAVPIASVKEIVNPLPLTALPYLASAVAGVADHRGDVIVVVDLRARFGLMPSMDQSRAKWVLIAVGGKTVGLIVDHVTDVFGTGRDHIRPSPSLGRGEDARGIAGVITHNGMLTFVLDVEKLEALTAEVPDDVLKVAAGAAGGQV